MKRPQDRPAHLAEEDKWITRAAFGVDECGVTYLDALIALQEVKRDGRRKHPDKVVNA